MIPKIIHLTSNSLDIEEKFQDNFNILKEYYPDFDIRIYDDEEIERFTKEKFPKYKSTTFDHMPFQIMRVDTVRYMLMKVFGGIYCDLDIKFLHPIKFQDGITFIEREWTWPYREDIRVSVHNCIFASTEGHPFWDDILNQISKKIFLLNIKLFFRLKKKNQNSVFDTTGPNAISSIITNNKLQNKYNNINILDRKTIYQHGMSKGKIEEASVVHQTSGSWRE